jgi:hypothetical protein
MRKLPAILIFVICLTACSSIPFQKTVYVPLDSVEPQALVEKFKNNSPENFRLINTIVFEYNWNKLSAIGYIDVDTIKQTFTVVCINHVGIKLFELSGDRNRITVHFMLEQFSEKGDFANTVGGDIGRIYFDLFPSSEANIKKKKYQVKFTEPSAAGIVEYVFAGAEGYLVEKGYYEGNMLNWKISYYEYQQKDGKIYPAGIILKNYKYGYTLTIKLKEFPA